jgi:hypothetical protein
MKTGISPAKPTPEKHVLLEAVDLTLSTLGARARCYRNLVVAVCLVATTSLLTALVLKQVLALLGFILLVPLTGGFTFFDKRQVMRWREQILKMRDDRNLDLGLFSHTIAKLKHLPQGTIQAMLATLPAELANVSTTAQSAARCGRS